MRLPSGDEYNLAVQNPKTCFFDAELQNGKAQSNSLGLPFPYSGGFTTTYKVTSGTAVWAVRCFTREVAHLRARYQAIGLFIAQKKPAYLVEAGFMEKGIRINGLWQPIIKMRWIEGDLLNVRVGKSIGQGKEVIEGLAKRFKDLIGKMSKDGLIHGDLQHGNIICKGDDLFLIDYDCASVPGAEGVNTSEAGHPNFQHPQRLPGKCDREIDSFSAIAIYIALKALAVKPQLWSTHNNGENLLFKKEDFANPKNSQLFYELSRIPEITQMVGQFAAICLSDLCDVPMLRDFVSQKKSRASVNINRPFGDAMATRFEKCEQDILNDLYGKPKANAVESQACYTPSGVLGGHIPTPATLPIPPMTIPAGQQKKKSDDSWALNFAIITVGIAILFALLSWASKSQGTPSPAGSVPTAPSVQPNAAGSGQTAPSISPQTCPAGQFRSTDSDTCVSGDEYCAEKFGTGNIIDATGRTCTCDTGLVKSSKSSTCITHSGLCNEKYLNTEWDGTYCDCKSDYVWNKDRSACDLNPCTDPKYPFNCGDSSGCRATNNCTSRILQCGGRGWYCEGPDDRAACCDGEFHVCGVATPVWCPGDATCHVSASDCPSAARCEYTNAFCK